MVLKKATFQGLLDQKFKRARISLNQDDDVGQDVVETCVRKDLEETCLVLFGKRSLFIDRLTNGQKDTRKIMEVGVVRSHLDSQNEVSLWAHQEFRSDNRTFLASLDLLDHSPLCHSLCCSNHDEHLALWQLD